MTKHQKSDRFIKYLLAFTALYFLIHIGIAAADSTIIINEPNGGQMVCINQRGVVTCF